MCESLVRSRGDCLYTCLGYQEVDFIDSLISFSCCTKELKDKWECLYLRENSRKKESVVSELARGRVSKFST